MKPQSAFAVQPAREVCVFALLTQKENMKLFDEIYKSIERRAYEMFEYEGSIPGRDVQHWFQAEAELLQQIHAKFTEENGMVVFRAEVPGFTAKDLAVRVEPITLSIAGRRVYLEERKMHGEDVLRLYRIERIFRVMDLPAEVDPARAQALLGGGVLELRLPKAADTGKSELKLLAA
jgi:HSP20 family molecular chaperone IbpA